jgi:hypothetical protein
MPLETKHIARALGVTLNRDAVPGSVWQHYKSRSGDTYRIIACGFYEPTTEPVVIYQGGELIWVRPLDVFLEQIEVDGQKVYRFERVG